MEKQNKDKFLAMVSGYCSLRGLDKEQFLEERKLKYGTGMDLVKGVLEEIKADKETLDFAEQVNNLVSWKDMQIMTAEEADEFLSKVAAPLDKEIFEQVIQKGEADE